MGIRPRISHSHLQQYAVKRFLSAVVEELEMETFARTQGMTDIHDELSTRRSPRTETQGILRIDTSKPRRNSGGSVDFRLPDKDHVQIEPASPQPSVDRLSVSFRDRSDCSDTSVTVNVFDPTPVTSEMVTFSENAPPNGEEDEDDYSASITQILSRRESARRASQRRRRRRSSSPFPQPDGTTNEERRRASVFTNSSGETVVTVDDGAVQEQIFENIRLHKEVLNNVKRQPWSMRRKMKLVKQAKQYVKKHEGELQERLAQSRSTRDILASFNMMLLKNLQYSKRELSNMASQFIPWELRIKEIESHFGSAVASYFTFLRWMFWVNLVITVVLACFVMIPELLIGDRSPDSQRWQMTSEESSKSTYLMTMWDFEGVLKYSPIFYGYYTGTDRPGVGYRLPFAYFIAGLAVYVYSFVATLRRMAKNSRMSKLSEKDDECTFTWKLFTGWDYMIGNAETAHNRVASIVLGFKEALLEETEKKKDGKNWRVIGLRVLVNLLVSGLLTVSAYIVFVVVRRSTEVDPSASWWRNNEITISLSIISLIFPIFFEVLGMLEGYHPRKSLRIQLARIMVLNLLNLYTLIFSLFWKISQMVIELQGLNPNRNNTTEPTASPMPRITFTQSAKIVTIGALLTTASVPVANIQHSSSTTLMPSMSNVSFSSTPFDFNSSSSFDLSTDDTTSTSSDPYQSTFDYEDDGDDIITQAANLLTSEAPMPSYQATESPRTTSTEFPTPDPEKCVGKCEKTRQERAKKLSSLCWETMFGQELVKLTVMDLVLTVISTLVVDFIRALLVRVLNHCWCWDLEKTFPQYGDFKIAENILHLVNNQGMVWMGMFFSPGLPAINLVKLIIMMYLRSWAVLTCNVPHEVVFRASRSNNFYLALLLTMLFLCVLPVGFAIVWIEPSWHCGPFADYSRTYHIITDYLNRALPATLQKVLQYIASPAIVIPLLMLLILIIYYLISLTNSLREANSDLKIQLRRERTEERRKMFQLVDKKNRKSSDAFEKWRNILPEMSPVPETDAEKDDADKANRSGVRKELISRLLKRMASSGTSDEETALPEPKKSSSQEDGKQGTSDNRGRTSISSDKIPVIKISKTESEGNILELSPRKRFQTAAKKTMEKNRKMRKRGKDKSDGQCPIAKQEKIPPDLCE